MARIQNAESAAALLKRFTFYIDPSITDQEEKDAALRGILGAGELAILPIRTFCAKAESLTWPLKILKDLVPSDRYVEEVIRLLESFDTEYTRNVDPKQQLITELEHFTIPSIRLAVERFLEDASDDVRFAAVATVFAQEDAASAGPLARSLAQEESVRVKNRTRGRSRSAWLGHPRGATRRAREPQWARFRGPSRARPRLPDAVTGDQRKSASPRLRNL